MEVTNLITEFVDKNMNFNLVTKHAGMAISTITIVLLTGDKINQK